MVVVVPGLLVLAIVQLAASSIAVLAVGSAHLGTEPDDTVLLVGSLVIATPPAPSSPPSLVGFGALIADFWPSR